MENMTTPIVSSFEASQPEWIGDGPPEKNQHLESDFKRFFECPKQLSLT